LKKRSLFYSWLFFCAIIIIGYVFSQVLYSTNFWGSIGVSPYQLEFITWAGMFLFRWSLIGGWSLITGILVWHLLSRFFSPTPPLLLLFFEIFQAWLSLSVFEVSWILYDRLYIIFVEGETYLFIPYLSLLPTLFTTGWINLLLVCLFYTVIGFQALRKRLAIEKFLSRVLFDFGQALAMFFEGLLLFFPIVWPDFLEPVNFLNLILFSLFLGYYTILVIFFIEYTWWAGRRIEREKERSGEDFTSRILFLQISSFFFPQLGLISFVPYPFFLFLVSPGLWFLFFLIILFSSFVGILLRHLVKLKTPRVYENVEDGMQYIKYQFDFLFASRGTMFNYPQPIDILGEDALTEVITGRREKVTLKMACGHCYHVFKATTFKDGSKVTPIPCPFCRSMSTTPVWE
jgi:hypothetical protein